MELGSHCGLCETDIDWERTSQVPELGFFCQPAIPATHPRIRWQRKLSFPPAMSHWLHSGMSGKEVTDHVCSLSLSVFHICLFLTPPPLFFFFFKPIEIGPPQQKTSEEGSLLSIPIAHKAWHICQNLPGMVEMREVAMTTVLPLATCACPTGEEEEEATPFSPPSQSFLTLLSERNCPTRAH